MYPRDGIGFVDPDNWFPFDGIQQTDGTTRNYKDFEELFTHIRNYRSANRLPEIPHLEETVFQYLYEMEDSDSSLFTKKEITADYPRSFFKDLRVGVGIVKSLSKVAILGEGRTGGYGWVDKKTATDRGEACYNCPYNKILKKGIKERAADAMANLFSRHRKTEWDDKLESCGVCGCPNRVKTKYSKFVIINNHPDEIPSQAFPKRFVGIHSKKTYSCWMREILEEAGI